MIKKLFQIDNVAIKEQQNEEFENIVIVPLKHSTQIN